MKTFAVIITLLLSFSAFTQAKESQKVKDSIAQPQDYFDKVTFNLGGGVFIPRGKLNDFFGIGPLMELNFNFPIDKTKSIDVVGQFVIPNQVENFGFVRTIDTVQAKSQMMFNFFIKFNKTLKTTRKSTLKAFLGLGISTITTDARNPFYSGQEDENKYEFISALLIAPGIDYKFRIAPNSKLAIGINYQYSPYRLEGALQRDIGSSAIVPRIQFTF